MRALAIVMCLAASVSQAATIPHDAQRYQRELTRNARLVWGLDAPVATFAAQIHQESRWNPNARSAVGARGLAQFMPSTENWINGAYPNLNTCDREAGAGSLDCQGSTGATDVATNPIWAMRALVTYDKWLWDRTRAIDDCNHMALVLCAYNGGLGWCQRDQKLALAKGVSVLVWFDSVERFNAGRSPAAFNENRAYPRLILLRFEPIYEAAGWGEGSCS